MATIPNQVQSFEEAETWLAFLRRLNLHDAVPLPTATKYLRAQKLYAYAWLEYDFIKAAELVALSSLEGALSDCYGRAAMKVRKNGNDRKEPMLAERLLGRRAKGDAAFGGSPAFAPGKGSGGIKPLEMGGVVPQVFRSWS